MIEPSLANRPHGYYHRDKGPASVFLVVSLTSSVQRLSPSQAWLTVISITRARQAPPCEHRDLPRAGRSLPVTQPGRQNH